MCELLNLVTLMQFPASVAAAVPLLPLLASHHHRLKSVLARCVLCELRFGPGLDLERVCLSHRNSAALMSRNADGQIYRCCYTPGDVNVASPYKLDQVGHQVYSLRTQNFVVRRNKIKILMSDADPQNILPEPSTTRIVKGGVETITDSQVIPFFPNDDTKQKWLVEIGEYVAAVMFGKQSASDIESLSSTRLIQLLGHEQSTREPFALTDFPDSMLFYLLESVNSNRPNRKDTNVYLRGTLRAIQHLYVLTAFSLVDSGVTFRTPLEFARHAMWLMDGAPPGEDGMRTVCLCKYCATERLPGNRRARGVSQEPISSALRILAGRPLKRDLKD